MSPLIMLRTSDGDGGVVCCPSETVVCCLTTAVFVEEVVPIVACQTGGTARAATAAGGRGGAGCGAGGRGRGAGGGGGGAAVGTTVPPEHTALASARSPALLSRRPQIYYKRKLKNV